MSSQSSSPHAVIVLPSAATGLANLPDIRGWLSRGQLRYQPPRDELLDRVLPVIGHAPAGQGYGALRLWGQTGDRPDVWVTAADPVYLEPMLDHLALHALRADELPPPQLRAVYDTLQESMSDGGGCSLVRIGQYGYLRCSTPFATASLSATVADGGKPDNLMPQGVDAAAHDRLQAEVQMTLHDHPVNRERDIAGMRPVNSLWFWGGGTAPQRQLRSTPMLFAGDPLFRGYWNSRNGEARPWPGSIDRCLQVADGDFVAVSADVADQFAGKLLAPLLSEVRAMLQAGRLRKLTLIFRDGLEVQLKRIDHFKFWRRMSSLLEGA